MSLTSIPDFSLELMLSKFSAESENLRNVSEEQFENSQCEIEQRVNSLILLHDCKGLYLIKKHLNERIKMINLAINPVLEKILYTQIDDCRERLMKKHGFSSDLARQFSIGSIGALEEKRLHDLINKINEHITWYIKLMRG